MAGIRTYLEGAVFLLPRQSVDHDKNLTRLLSRVKKSYPEDRVAVEYVTRRKREQTLSDSSHISRAGTLMEKPN